MDLDLSLLLSFEDEWSPWNLSLYLSALRMFLSRQGQALPERASEGQDLKKQQQKNKLFAFRRILPIKWAAAIWLEPERKLETKDQLKKKKEKKLKTFFGNCASAIINFSIPVFFPRPFFFGNYFFSLCCSSVKKFWTNYFDSIQRRSIF